MSAEEVFWGADGEFAGNVALVRFLVLLALLLCAGCGVSSVPVASVVSPEGWCAASIQEYGDAPSGLNTSVYLAFDGGRCGAGAVHFSGVGHAIALRWIDAATLEVAHPAAAVPQRNASGEIIQCFERKVRVVLVARSPLN